MRNPNCRDCGLWKSSKTTCVWGDGPSNAKIFVIGEAPGEAEARTGKPFQGKSGQILRNELSRSGLKDVYITNVVKCRPPDNRTPTKDEIKACRKYLEAELEAAKPAYVLTLGATASKAVLKKSKITTDHGLVVEMPTFRGMPAFHPAYALRDPSKLPAFQQDIGRFSRLVQGQDRKASVEWSIVQASNIDQFFHDFSQADEFSFDLETSGLFPHDGRGSIRCMSIGLEREDGTDHGWVIPLEIRGTPFQTETARRQVMKLIFDLAEGKKGIAQNGKFDNQWLRRYYGRGFYLSFDTGLAHHVLDENTPHGLKELTRVYLDEPDYDVSLKEKLNPTNLTRFYEYAAKDAVYTLRLKKIFAKQLAKDRTLRRLFYRLVMRAARAFTELEEVGLTVDVEKLDRTEQDVRKRLEETRAELNKMAGREVNWNSPKQVAEVLFNDLGLNPVVFTDSGATSTGEATLVELQSQHPIAATLVRYRELEKFLSTYLEGWREYMVGDRLYFSYKLHGTVTGRYSCRLHQVPRDGTIRSLIGAPPGWVFVQADFSQAELRTIAEVAQDLEMMTCFRRGIDIHWRTLMFTIAANPRGEYVPKVIETAELHCLQQGLPADRDSCEILSEVWKHTPDGESTSSYLEVTDKEGSKGWSRLWRESARRKESNVEGRSQPSPELPEDFLRSLLDYQKLRRTSQGRKPSKRGSVQFDSAMSLLSSLSPSAAQKLWSGWKEARKKAKATAFGFCYGMQAHKFIEYAKLKYGFEPTVEEAEISRNAFFGLYRGLGPWHDRQRRLVRLNGYVRNLIGRVRRLPGAHSTDRSLVSEAERQSINAPIQGFIGDFKAMALVEIHETMPRDRLKVVGEVHDSILMIVREDSLDLLHRARKIMEHPALMDEFGVQLAVPMTADFEVGAWGAGKSFTTR